MATVKVGYPSTDSWVGYAEETTFGSAIADSSNFSIFKQLDNNAPAFVPDGYWDETNKNRAKNISDIDDYYYNEGGRFQRYALPEVLANATDLKHMLYAACQIVTEGEATPYLATYTMAGATKPDFSLSAGYFFTLLVKSPMASYSQKLTSCILENLTINITPENGGRTTMSGTVLTGQGYIDNSNPSGTNDFTAAVPPNFFDVNNTLQINSVDAVFYSIIINIANVFDFTGRTAGNAENYTLISQKVTGTVILKYDAATDAFLRSKGSSVGGLFDLDIQSDAAAGHFGLDCNDVLIKNVGIDRGGTDTVQKIILNLEFMNDYSATQSIVFKVSDAVDAGW